MSKHICPPNTAFFSQGDIHCMFWGCWEYLQFTVGFEVYPKKHQSSSSNYNQHRQ